MKTITKSILHIASFTCIVNVGISQNFRWNQLGNNITGQVAQEQFGTNHKISYDGLTVIGGSPNSSESSSFAGSARVFEWDNGTWSQKGNAFFGAADDDLAGSSVAIDSSGNTIVIGTMGKNVGSAINAGMVQVYDWNGTTWIQRGSDILGAATADFVGQAACISNDGNTIAIGTNKKGSGFNAGEVFIYDWDGTSWTQRGNAIGGTSPSNFSGGSQNLLSMSSKGNVIGIGSYSNDENGTDAGQVRVFEWNGTSWVQKGSTFYGLHPGDNLGSVSIGNNFGNEGDYVVVGAPSNDSSGTDAGMVQVYYMGFTDWLPAGDALFGDSINEKFGTSVSINQFSNTLAVGSEEYQENLTLQGKVTLFDVRSIAVVQKGNSITGDIPLGRIGKRVDVSADGKIFSLYNGSTDVPTSNSGHIGIYELCEPTTRVLNIQACEQYTLPSGKRTYYTDQDTTILDTITNQCGADSLLFIQSITIHPNDTIIDTIVACGSYMWIDGITYTNSNDTAEFVIENFTANGCDRIRKLNLTITNSTTGTDVQTACGSYTWIDGNTYTTNNNTATFNLVGGATNGCDSLVTLDLTITNSTTGTDVQTACGSYTWIDGNTYTSNNNTATFNLVGGAANGCDSLVTLDLTITNSTTGTDVQTACGSYTWIDGNTYTTNNNTATFNLVGGAANGCDSLVTLDLTINNSTTGTDVQTACGSYTWIDGNTYTSNNNTATFNLVGGSANGCDSLVTLDLTITNSTTGTDMQTACGSYTWIDGNTYTSNNNTATFNLVGGSANGCDSLVTLDLTITNSTTGTDVQTACGSYTWIDGNTYTSNNNTATFNLVGGATNGCDSLVTLDLTIEPINTSVTSAGNIITADEAGLTYQWIDCADSSEISGETNQVFTASTNGNYAVIVSDGNCIDTSICVNVMTTGINHNSLETVNIYPNPVLDDLFIDFGDIQEEVSLSLIDLKGKVLFTEENVNDKVFKLSLRNYGNGVYIIRINTSNNSKTYKLIKK